jgi:4-diphosphocytidyl-2-C-methyl-D-erythritol kinase
VQIRRCAAGIEILAPAKVNLFFEVLNRRDDGYHEVETLMVPISVYDTLRFESAPPGKVSLVARWGAGLLRQTGEVQTGEPPPTPVFGDLPQGEQNLAVKAVRLLAQRAGTDWGAKLHLVKRIPAAAGLGGGSSDAAAALLAANLIWKLNWPIDILAGVAAEIGSDVSFFLKSRTSICRGRGDSIEPISGKVSVHLVIIRPPAGLATALVYRHCQIVTPPRQIEPVVNALGHNNLSALGPIAHNRLLQAARTLSPWIDRTLEVLRGENCPAIGMSGSGSSCFALCRTAQHARNVAARLRCRQPGIGWIQAVCTV